MSKRCLLGLALLLLSPSLSFSDSSGIPQTELIAALGRISQGLESASERQDEISSELEKALNEQRNILDAQKDISRTLSTVVEERLPSIEERVKSQQASFDAYKAREDRDDALLLGATIVAILLAVLSLVL